MGTVSKRGRAAAVIGPTTTRQVAFVGPFGVGKTTAVKVIADGPVLVTEAPSSAAGTRAAMKKTTTVGLDYGEWGGPAGQIAVVGTPGQARFRTARTAATTRNTHLILLAYGQNAYAVDECEEWIRFLGEDTWARLTVAVTRTDQPGGPALEAYREMLDRFDPRIRLTTVDPRDRDSVEAAVRTSLALDAPVAG